MRKDDGKDQKIAPSVRLLRTKPYIPRPHPDLVDRPWQLLPCKKVNNQKESRKWNQ